VTADDAEPVLSVADLSVRLQRTVEAVRSVSFELYAGEMLGLVGESGSGKSVTLKAICGLIPPGVRAEIGGSASYDGVDLIALGPEKARKRSSLGIGFVFQDPLSSLNPGFRIGWQMHEALRFRVRGLRKADRFVRIRETLPRVGLTDTKRIIHSYPHELSGGMRQRVMIAMALLAEPQILFADEPTTALDVTLSADILDLLASLQRQRNLATVLVSHDLNLIVDRCNRVVVMYAGRVVETGDSQRLFTAPRHPYTVGLLAATVDPFRRYDDAVDPIRGEPGTARNEPGCPFAPRCPFATDDCRAWDPRLEPVDEHQAVACLRHEEIATQMAASVSDVVQPPELQS
jgi:oligopeptide/dipeptide ABC transporter ATP-binding protein